ncbi:CRS2-associated factor 2, mitochondrial isoform X2 [Cryptomeria japonica]|uniref:CRS2-associated factor 2, mitochondrial isoform X2 n=1 Tax=Cryptomeria japonica TaxID=3369 RepID=UPI0025ABEFFB|nr:CRS2-associated factor 2, mitochondrial isoform X2 [Cryptomeria japonica]
MKLVRLNMATAGRGLRQQQTFHHNALQSLFRTFSHNIVFWNDAHSGPGFQRCNDLKPSQNLSDPKTLNNKNHKKSSNESPGQSPWSLESKDKAPIISSLPFDFQYSYSESNPNIAPIGFREKKFSPFGPGRIDRSWTGWSAPAPAPFKDNADEYKKRRQEILGEPLTEAEIGELVERYSRGNCDSQINLGRGGVTHNMLVDIHNHWKRAEAVRIKCLGVPTIDMDNVCFHLEDKTGGKIISRRTNILILYRGRHYDPKQRPVIPLMLWRPHEPIYPRLINNVVDGLTFEETKDLRNRGLNAPALTKLTQNGCYVRLVQKVRDAFVQNEVLRIDCTGMETSDYKKIGVKIRDLVPCVLLIFLDQQIVIWRGKNYDSTKAFPSESLSGDKDSFSPHETIGIPFLW